MWDSAPQPLRGRSKVLSCPSPRSDSARTSRTRRKHGDHQETQTPHGETRFQARVRHPQAKHGNPAQGIELPSERGERTRRLKPGEEELVLEAAARAQAPW